MEGRRLDWESATANFGPIMVDTRNNGAGIQSHKTVVIE